MKRPKSSLTVIGVLFLVFALLVGGIGTVIAQAPTVDTVDPNEGGRGQTLTNVSITGSGFAELENVSFGAGVTVNVGLWLFIPSVSWLWWNAIGFILAIAVIFSGSAFLQHGFRSPNRLKIPKEKRSWKVSYGILVIYVVILVLFLLIFPKLFL